MPSGMDDLRDSAVSAQAAQSAWAFVKYIHVMNGLYLWEFSTTLDYEWRVFRGHLPYGWSIWIYSFTRVTALAAVILCLAIMNVTTPFNCQLWSSITAAFFALSTITASLLNVLRIVAIWNRNKVAVTLVITVWVISVASHVQSAALLRIVRVPGQAICVPVNTESCILSYIPAIISDMALLIILLVGLLVLRRHGGGTFGLARLLWKQGVIWLVLGTVTEIPPLVLIALHLNYQFNIMFVSPFSITVIISATRMHRCLVDFASRPPDIPHENLQVSSLEFSEAKRTDTAPNTLHRIEIVMDTASCDTSTREQVS
ncbi:hypothetical protein DFH94DRAFT_695989 [Russula ochroleuca]|uniref:Uncharacterized protein n=1 Tax=Russula ochroleuca TaxID=152965 RepID=A0A9P5K084_9AGAM|nr:hypothetical protein DFH94DRAFT_695989 [Russula ochroleuca]